MRLQATFAVVLAAAMAGVPAASVADAGARAPLRYRLTSTPIVTFDRTDGVLSYDVYVRLNRRLSNREVKYLRQVSLGVARPGAKRSYSNDNLTAHVGGATSRCLGAEGAGLGERDPLPASLRHPAVGKPITAVLSLTTTTRREVLLRRTVPLEAVPAGRYALPQAVLVRRLGC